MNQHDKEIIAGGDRETYVIYDPSTHMWLAAVGPSPWTDKLSEARHWSDFYEARNFLQSLPNYHGLRVASHTW